MRIWLGEMGQPRFRTAHALGDLKAARINNPAKSSCVENRTSLDSHRNSKNWLMNTTIVGIVLVSLQLRVVALILRSQAISANACTPTNTVCTRWGGNTSNYHECN